MNLDYQELLPISKELDEISIKSLLEKDGRLIGDRRSFCKTETYRKLRQGKLTDQEVSFMLNNYVFTNDELCSLVVEKLGELNITRAINIGAINYSIKNSDFNERANPSLNFHRYLINKIVLINPEQELLELSNYFLSSKELKSSHSVRLVYRDFLQLLWFAERNKLSKEKERVNLEALKKNHLLVMSVWEQLIDKPTTNLRVYDTGRRHMFFSNEMVVIDPFKVESDDYLPILGKELRPERVSDIRRILTISEKCPVSFVREVLSSSEVSKKFNPTEKIFTMVSLVSLKNLSPSLSVDREMRKIEALHKVWGVDKKLVDFVVASFQFLEREYIDHRLVENLSKCSIELPERKRVIYNTYFKEIPHDLNRVALLDKLKVMVLLEIPDVEIADFIMSADKRERNDLLIFAESVYKCNPVDSRSYPGKEVLKLLMEYQINDFYYIMIPEALEDFEALFQIYRDRINSSYSKAIITWEQANSAEFLKEVVRNEEMTSRRKINFLELVNISKIGINVYLETLKEREGFYPVELPERFSKEFTKDQLFENKDLFEEDSLMTSPYLGYDTIDFFLNEAEREEVDSYSRRTKESKILSGVRNNKVLSKGELISCATRMQSLNGIQRSFSISRSTKNREDRVIGLNIGKNHCLTVTDFNEFYKGGSL